MPTEFKISKEEKILSWEDRDTYVVVNINKELHQLKNLDLPDFMISILTTEKGRWKQHSHKVSSGSTNWSRFIQRSGVAGLESNVLINTNNPSVFLFDEQGKSKSYTIQGQIGQNFHAFGFDSVIQPPQVRFSQSSRDNFNDLATANKSRYRDEIIQAYDKSCLEKFVNGKQYEIVSDDGTFFYEVSRETKFVDEIADKLREVYANELKEELETWLSDEDLWKSPYFKNSMTLEELTSQWPKLTQATGQDLSGHSWLSKLKVSSYYGTTPETEFALQSNGFYVNYSNSSSGKLHWDPKQENWAVEVTTKLQLFQEYDVAFLDDKRVRQKSKKHVAVASKNNTRLIPLSFDNKDGRRPMLKELASLGEFSKLSVTGPDGKVDTSVKFKSCLFFKMEDLVTQPKWLQDIVSLAPKALLNQGNSTTKTKPLSRSKPSTTPSPNPVQYPRDFTPQNQMSPDSELNWHIVEALQRIAEAMERIADKNND